MKKCDVCGNNLNDDAKFCTFCGKNFGDSNVESIKSETVYSSAEEMEDNGEGDTTVLTGGMGGFNPVPPQGQPMMNNQMPLQGQPMMNNQNQQFGQPMMNNQYGQPMMNNQNQQYGQPMMNNQNQQYGQPMMNNQNQQYGQPMMNNQMPPYGQPMMNNQMPQYGQPRMPKKPMNPKAKKAILFGGIGIVAIVAVVFVLSIIFGGGQGARTLNKAVDTYFTSTADGDYKKFMKVTIIESDKDTYESTLENYEDNEDYFDYLDDIKMKDVKITDKDKLSKSEINDVEETLDDYYDLKVKVKECYDVDVEYSISYFGSSYEESDTLRVAKIDGKWYVLDENYYATTYQ